MADACADSGVAACAEFELDVELEHAAREAAARPSVSATMTVFVATMRRPHPSAGPFSSLFMGSSLRLVVKPGLLHEVNTQVHVLARRRSWPVWPPSDVDAG